MDVEGALGVAHDGRVRLKVDSTPASYQLSSGEQFVAISVGGGDVWGKGDYVLAFRLRR